MNVPAVVTDNEDEEDDDVYDYYRYNKSVTLSFKQWKDLSI